MKTDNRPFIWSVEVAKYGIKNRTHIFLAILIDLSRVLSSLRVHPVRISRGYLKLMKKQHETLSCLVAYWCLAQPLKSIDLQFTPEMGKIGFERPQISSLGGIELKSISTWWTWVWKAEVPTWPFLDSSPTIFFGFESRLEKISPKKNFLIQIFFNF